MSLANSVSFTELYMKDIKDVEIVLDDMSYFVQADTELTFHDFDIWTKQRFGINKNTLLSYYDCNNKEIIPTGYIASKYHKIYVKKFNINNNDSTSSSTSIPTIFYDELWSNFVFYGPYMLLIILGMTIAPDSEKKRTIKESFELVLELTSTTEWKDWILEAYIGFITWSTTYLFIRRALNPENKNPLEKHGPDAWFGGFAAATAVLLKKILLKTLDVHR